MKKILYGFYWKKRAGINPALLSATVHVAPVEHKMLRLKPSCWTLDYEFSGYGRYRVGTRSLPWRPRLPHTAHLYPPNIVFWEDTRHGEEWRNSAWIFFSGGSRTGLEHLVRNRFGYAQFLDPKEKIGNLIRRMAEIGKRRAEQGFWEAQATLCEALDLLANARLITGETYTVDEETKRSGMSLFAETVDIFLKEHLAERITLPDIARHLNVSVSLLAHHYRQTTGGSPKAALTRFRIEQTKVLLLKGYLLKTIAGQLGFADAFHLSKTFKHLEGLSPRDFIRKPHG